MTIRELIEKLQDAENRHGSDTLVVLSDMMPVYDVLEMNDISGYYCGVSCDPKVMLS